MDGVSQPDQINPDAVKKFRSGKRSSHTTAELVDGILAGNRTLLSRAITLVESSLPAHRKQAQEVIAGCLEHLARIQDTCSPPFVGRGRGRGSEQHSASSIQHPASIRVGITGVPGVGKSTFIEALGKHLTGMGHKLAVLAIDPSSSRSKGSILGDKTRMEELSVDPNAFIRPSPSAGSLGGVARKTRETIILCEAAGFDVIFVETVGVGQSETAVHSMVDFFLLLMLAGAGDELQGIKRGIIEMADAIVINKADGDNIGKARLAMREYANALHLFPPPSGGWTPVVDTCSSRTKAGIGNVWNIIMQYRDAMSASGFFAQRRREQNRNVLYETIEEELRRNFYSRKEIAQAMVRAEKEIMEGRANPYEAALELIRKSGSHH